MPHCNSYSWIPKTIRKAYAPQRIIDYLIFHEFVHLREPTHSDTFWSKLQATLPDYRDRKEGLSIHGNTLKP